MTELELQINDAIATARERMGELAVLEAENRRLRDELEIIRQIASGEAQVADDDTEAMGIIDRRAVAALGYTRGTL